MSLLSCYNYDDVGREAVKRKGIFGGLDEGDGFTSCVSALQERKKREEACIVPQQGGGGDRAISSTQITPHNVIGPLAMP